jgi:murein DD-endopeptidase MepM/ murein hydrolase activator NlpD
LSDAAYRGRHRPPAGRHRAARSRTSESTGSSLPRFAGSGYLLPTAAAATLVLTATGAHIGGTAGAPTASATPVTAMTASGLVTEDAIERDVIERSGRDSARASALTGTDSFDPAESGRADQQDAADAADRTQAQADAAAAKAAADAAAAQAQVQAQVQAQADAAAQQKAQADAAAAAAHNWVPFINAGYQLTSGFGMRWGAMHPGQDFAVPVGTPVKAMSSGTVIFAGWQGGYGNKVEIQYWDGTVSWFCHNSKLLVTQGEKVAPGELVSMSGNTGHSTGPHIHVEVHPQNGSPIPPLPWLKKMGTMP